MPHTRSVSIGFFIGVGSRYESDEQSGASHFIEHMLLGAYHVEDIQVGKIGRWAP
jgi:predicted Zn-dependent peptidase